MLSTISWQGYWTAIALATAIYYCLVYFLHFRGNLRIFHQEESAHPFVISDLKEDKRMPSLFDEQKNLPKGNGDEPVALACMEELDAFFEN